MGLPAAALALLELHRYLKSGPPVAHAWLIRWNGGGGRALVLFGSGWLLAILANAYTLVFFPILVALWCIWSIRPREWRRLVPVAAVAAVATLPLIPIALE